MNRFIKMKETDMVATALVDLKKNDVAQIFTPANELVSKVIALENIPYGNKIALCEMKAGHLLKKCGSVIGECTQNINIGDLVHVHNVKSTVVDIPPVFKKEIMRQMNIDIKESE